MKYCKIIVRDEVNCQLKDLELNTRNKLVKKFSYEIPGARFMPAFKLGRWNGKENFFSLGGSTFINLLPEILPILIEEGYDFEIDDNRTYQRSFNFDPISQTSFDNRSWPVGHPIAGQPILLRDYQVDAINAFLREPQSLQELATGFGKTITTAAMSATVEKYGRSLVIVPNKSLVTQTESDYINMGLDVGVYFGDRKEVHKTHTICTWQSLNVLANNPDKEEATFRLLKNPTNFTIQDLVDGTVCIIVDEVHMAKANALKTLLTGPFARIPIRWGLTGTIPKEEYAFKSIQCSLGNVIGQLSARELQEEGHLAQCHVNIVQLVDHAAFGNYQSELKYLVGDLDRLATIANLINNIKASGNTLVLVDRISAGKELLSYLGDSAVFVSGATKASDRKEEYDEIATSTDKIIIATYGVAAVGINVPRLFNIVMVEPGKSFTRVIQTIGRGLRKAADKNEVTIWDITSNCKFSKRHLTKRKQYYKEAQYPFSLEKLEWK
jgi:superfamily II DNA or RNA helicase